jgi:hypothetical protein
VKVDNFNFTILKRTDFYFVSLQLIYCSLFSAKAKFFLSNFVQEYNPDSKEHCHEKNNGGAFTTVVIDTGNKFKAGFVDNARYIFTDLH